jgi:peptide-methionine (R)-S-oxide reductase
MPRDAEVLVLPAARSIFRPERRGLKQPRAASTREHPMMTKRQFLLSGATFAAFAAVATKFGVGGARSEAAGEVFEVTKTEEEWRAILTPEQFNVLRREGTEYPGTSALLEEQRKGIFTCAGCDLPVFESDKKFESGTGWPSFWAEIEGNVKYTEDRSLLMVRTEEHCRRCGGHLGHVFDDGPPPTGKRHCINGVSLVFHPAEDQTTG